MKRVILLFLCLLFSIRVVSASDIDDLNKVLTDFKVGEPPASTDYLYLPEQFSEFTYYDGVLGKLRIGVVLKNNLVYSVAIKEDGQFGRAWLPTIFKHFGKPTQDVTSKNKAAWHTNELYSIIGQQNIFNWEYVEHGALTTTENTTLPPSTALQYSQSDCPAALLYFIASKNLAIF
ncbi:MAG: hypothetical protein H6Q74_2738 [Firmicutes bacterium]|nr:hypothetical protein [Bacillota bacterium]